MRLADAAPGRRFRDVIGELIDVGGNRLRVLPPEGTVVTVDAADVVAARAVGPRPTPFSQILELERLLAATWPAVETAEAGGWLLRYSEGYSRRANSALPIYGSASVAVGALTQPDAGLDAALARVERWYAERGARALVSVALPLSRRLDKALAARGWKAEGETAVLTKDAEGGDYTSDAVITHIISDDLLEQMGRGRPDVAAKVLGSGPNRAYAEIRRDGALVARGRAAIEGGTAAVTGIGTLPAYRRRGLGGEVLEALTAWAADAGARRIALQVETDNAAALALYARLGFTERYRYHYRGR
nr:GNAT family N-acetyltransferase [Glycomyces arizonensis]